MHSTDRWLWGQRGGEEQRAHSCLKACAGCELPPIYIGRNCKDASGRRKERVHLVSMPAALFPPTAAPALWQSNVHSPAADGGHVALPAAAGVKQAGKRRQSSLKRHSSL